MSVFVGDRLTHILNCIENGSVTEATNAGIIDLGLSSLPPVSKDSTDRNRTSPFAFTGNKFEFRAVGSNQSISFPAAVLNTIVAESLDYLAEEIKAQGAENIQQSVMTVLRKEIGLIRPVLFNGDNYTKEWEDEAAQRCLPNCKATPEALQALITDKALELFEKYGVLSRVELQSRYLIYIEKYIKGLEIEVKCLNNICMNQVIPAAVNYEGRLSDAIRRTLGILNDPDLLSAQTDILKRVAGLIKRVCAINKEILAKVGEANSLHDEATKAQMLCSQVKPKMDEVRTYVDELEGLVEDSIWPLPKFWEMLFIS
jgi:glutamine synthetase